jgi:hypothetical protein
VYGSKICSHQVVENARTLKNANEYQI